MRTLSAERCVACRRDSPRVTAAEIAELKPEIPDWQLLERDGIARLERVFHFPSFADALAFTNRVGVLAEAEGHRGPTRSAGSTGTTSSWPRRPTRWLPSADTTSTPRSGKATRSVPA